MFQGKTFILGIGAQRCGTTWLHDYLSASTEVIGCPIKEMHFFDVHLGAVNRDNWLTRMREQQKRLAQQDLTPERRARIGALQERLKMHDDPAGYFRYFGNRAGDKRFMCEITPSYSLLNADQFRWVRDFFAEAGLPVKIVYLMRDPIDRHRSFVQFRAKHRGRDFDFLKLLAGKNAAAQPRYDITLENVRKVFEPDQIITAFYEHLFSDPDTHLKAITDSVGIEYIKPNTAQRINAAPQRSTPLSEEELSEAKSRFAPVYDYINREFGDQKPKSWYC